MVVKSEIVLLNKVLKQAKPGKEKKKIKKQRGFRFSTLPYISVLALKCSVNVPLP
jgi:hypothetical protein